MLGEKISEFIFALLMITVIIILFTLYSPYHPDCIRIILFCFSFFFGILLNFILFYGILACSFRISEVSYFFEVISVTIAVVSGGILPIDIFGEKILFFLKILPFQYIAYFPINIIVGKMKTPEVWTGLAMQFSWIIVCGIVINLFWNYASKKIFQFRRIIYENN